MKNNKMKDKLGKLCSERKACRQKWLATLCLSGKQMCMHGIHVRAIGIIELAIPKWFCHHNWQHSFKLHACSEYLKPTLLLIYS